MVHGQEIAGLRSSAVGIETTSAVGIETKRQF